MGIGALARLTAFARVLGSATRSLALASAIHRSMRFSSRWSALAPFDSSNRSYKRIAGAGDGNRTHVDSLEGYCTTIVLLPQ